MSFIRTFRALWAAICNVRCITVRIIPDTPLITVFAFMAVVKFTTKVFNLITLVGRCEGTLTVPAAQFSFPIALHWRGIEGGVPHCTPQVFQGKAAGPMRTFVALYRLPTRCATSLAATHC